MADIVCDRRLYLTEDKSRVVEEGDPDSAWLFAVPGTTVKAAAVKRYGLTQKDHEVVLADIEPEPEPEPEPAPTPEPEPDEPDEGAVVDATAAAIKMADEYGIDLTDIEGTGADGRITKGDVEAALDASGE